MPKIEELQEDIVRLKAAAYDVLAIQEAITKEYQAQNNDCLNRLGNINNQIREKDQEIKKLEAIAKSQLGPENNS